MKTMLRRTKVVTAAVTLCLAGAVGVSSQAGAGSASLNVDPTTVQAGGVITVSQYCAFASGTATVDVTVSPGWIDPWTDPANPPVVGASDVTPDEAAQWSVQLTIPAGTEPGSYTVWARCSDGPQETREYGSVELTVTPGPTTTTSVAPTTTGSTTTGPASTDATTTTVAPAHAAAAAAVPGQPTYTG